MRLDEVILRGTRAAQPVATSRPGWLYCVTDEGNIVERSNGTAWEAYSPSGGGGVSPSTNNFRLTLASGNPVYAPAPATPSSTDTTGRTCTFASAHGWETGTIVTVLATGGGLTQGSLYYLGKISTTVVAFYLTLANANADTSRVALSASITTQIVPSGITQTTLYVTPSNGNQIALYNGAAWILMTAAEIPLSLAGSTANTNYDLFAAQSGSTVSLIKQAWTSDTVRSIGLARQDGVLVMSGDATRRYLGTFRADTTTTTIDDAGGAALGIGGRRFVWNMANRVCSDLVLFAPNGSWSQTTTGVWRQANATSSMKIEFVTGLAEDSIEATISVMATNNSNQMTSVAVGVDSTTVPSGIFAGFATSAFVTAMARYTGKLSGYHALNWLEFTYSGRGDFYGWNGQSGKSGMSATMLG